MSLFLYSCSLALTIILENIVMICMLYSYSYENSYDVFN